MQNLLEAFRIFAKYTDARYPTWCEHDTLHVVVNPEMVSAEDLERLETLGFQADDDDFYSFEFGSC
jgi:hypothetical protein